MKDNNIYKIRLTYYNNQIISCKIRFSNSIKYKGKKHY
jgi:hypothetical protein